MDALMAEAMGDKLVVMTVALMVQRMENFEVGWLVS
jgi:hypothetical protein